MNKNYTQDLFKYIKRCIFHVHKFYLVDTYFSTLTQILDDLANPENESIYSNFKFESDIKNFNMLIHFLDEKYKLFPIHMNYLLKIIQLFAFFCDISTKINEELNKGNFDYDNLFNIDSLYSEYIVYRENHFNFNYSLNNNINDNNENGMDIEVNNNIINNNSNDLYILDKEFAEEVKDKDQEIYIKNLIKDYTQFFKEILITTNTLPSSQDLINIIFNKLKIDFPKITYFQFISNILRSMLLNHLRSDTNFKLNYLNFLYNLSQSIKRFDPSLFWYFQLLNDIFQARIEKNNVNIIDEEAMKYLVLNQIKNENKINYETLPITAYNVALNYVTYVNQKISNAIYSPIIKKFTEIKSFRKLWGFDIFWDFYIYTKNDMVQNLALNTIINILELISNKEDDRNHLINTIFAFISTNKNNIRDNPQIKISIVRSLKVISVILGTKINKDIFENNNINGGNKNIRVLVKNYYFDFQDDEKYYINISNEQKVKNLKEFIINQIVCSQSNLEQYNKRIKSNQESRIITEEEEEKMNIDSFTPQNILTIDQLKKMVYNTNIMIHYKNAVLKDDFMVADYHIEENSTLLIFKGGGKTEEEFVPSEDLLKEGYLAIKTIFGNSLYFGEDIMKASIIKHKGNIEEAGLYLTVPENVQILKREMEEKKSKLEQKHDDIICLEEEKINLLIEVLNNNNDQEINRQIWELFG